VSVRGGQGRRRGERVHAAWHMGPPAEAAPGGACEANARRAHAQTSRPGRGMTAHGGDAAAMRGLARARRRAGAFPAPMLCMCPCLAVQCTNF
jgi:hypothetical protein